ncbi:hypothetical protein DH2020_043514 [Rehmannia glutinosa]|uniref:Uncharacterized protein n=1 Tax=Rehmannia glutinosa TaxID=99300 RepID=A0ABR0UKC0_REHGL
MSKMSEEIGDDELTVSIDKMLHNLSPKPENPSIYRVNDLLRNENEHSYDPRIISIGPYHRGKQHLNKMEREKKRYLKLLLASSNESSVDRYVKKIKGFEDRARKCYSEPIALGQDEFVQMLLLDGVFIVQFLRKYEKFDDAIFKFEHVTRHVLHDLLLFENQIPLFVLDEVFNLSRTNAQEKFGELVWPLVLPSAVPALASLQDLDSHHLLGLVHRLNCFTFSPDNNFHHVENINSASELKEAGIRFDNCKDDGNISWLDIRFNKYKKICVPTLDISDVTESWFRNMIAYEYYLPCDHPKYVTDYTFFLHCLVHAPRDAQLLRRYGIISNWLGGDEMVYHLINQLGTNVLTSEKFSYSDVFCHVNRHCKRRRYRWIAILRRDYFDSPWKLISLVAGIVILAVGIVQVVFAILSYRKQRYEKAQVIFARKASKAIGVVS